jgi:hypothetical protein
MVGPLWADDDLKQRASWDWPDQKQVRQSIDDWVSDLTLEDEQLEAIETLWNEADQGDGDLLEIVLDTISIADDAAGKFIKQCRGAGEEQTWIPSLPELEQLLNEERPAIVTDQLRLLYGKALAMHQLYNESRDQLAQLDTSQVAAPATLMFYRVAANYRVREFDPAKTELATLLEREAELPERYATIANLMQADLKQLQPDSLDEISRIMDSIKVRLHHGRAGTRVRDEEQEVIDKLSKMIEEKEKQLQQMQSQSGQAGGNQPSSPMQDSMLPSGGGAGDVDAKRLTEDTNWGDLPPKERKRALQELGKEFPSHYRDVIEEYFRNLARDESLE